MLVIISGPRRPRARDKELVPYDTGSRTVPLSTVEAKRSTTYSDGVCAHAPSLALSYV